MYDLFLQNKKQLHDWLLNKCVPLWFDNSIDHVNGGFFEQLNQDLTPNNINRRTRVSARQIFSFAQVKKIGSNINASIPIEAGFSWINNKTSQPNNYFCGVLTPEGNVVESQFNLYDHAFVILACASSYEYSGEEIYIQMAQKVFENIIADYSHPFAGFEESIPSCAPLKANPHMHMFEACLAWIDLGFDGKWRDIGEMIANLCIDKFIDSETFLLREFFNSDWTPHSSDLGRIIEPGHLFEWAWLLQRWAIISANPLFSEYAYRLIEAGERHGINSLGVCINEIWDDFSVKDANARLWPQTERIKAHAICANHQANNQTNQYQYHLEKLNQAISAMRLYFETPHEGLYYDLSLDDGTIVQNPSPTSTLYHIVCAIIEIEKVKPFS